MQSVVDEFAKEELLGRVDVHADRVIASVETVSFLVLIEFVDGKPTGYGREPAIDVDDATRRKALKYARELKAAAFPRVAKRR